MYLSSTKINQLLGRDVSLPSTKYYLGLSNSQQPGTLSFCDTEKFIREIEKNENVTALFVTEAITQKVTATAIKLIETEDPRYDFYYLINEAGKENYKEFKSEIHPSAKIHDRAYVADNNVKIGANKMCIRDRLLMERRRPVFHFLSWMMGLMMVILLHSR